MPWVGRHIFVKEDTQIAIVEQESLLNWRSEILTKCKHKFNYELKASKKKKKKQ